MVRTETATSQTGPAELANGYTARAKLFGDRAKRIERAEYDGLVEGIRAKARLSSRFINAGPVEQLTDKNSFGDLDFICLPHDQTHLDRGFFQGIYGPALRDYFENGRTHSLLIHVYGKGGPEEGIMVDFIQAKDQQDYDRKLMYYSKGHMSAVLSVLANRLGFKYSTEGFFKKYTDSKGVVHDDLLITGDLREGLRILGLDPAVYDGVQRSIPTDDEKGLPLPLDTIAGFIASSQYFDPRYYATLLPDEAKRASRATIQGKIMGVLAQEEGHGGALQDSDALFKRLFPDEYAMCKRAIGNIEEGIRMQDEAKQAREARLGQISSLFGINRNKQGLHFKKILDYLETGNINIEHLTPEIIEQIRRAVLEN